ncbi:unnamed protein product [Arabidopsis arenosa]|uniref:RNase H type-1 domain-containing protein n=1 Tax=Arabidopsis arenosa TaxID=38785 RepID=A0A8S2AN91_ARAAE|nr:unnamed protein product [Arabidopsis arenosa]
MWNLWKARNFLIFEGRSFSEQDIVLKSLKEAKDWQAAQLALPKTVSKPLAKTVPSSRELVHTCFTDAAWSASTGVCGQGWIFLDPQGNAPLRFSTSRSFVGSALTAEALAVRSALNALKTVPELSSIRRLEVHSDSHVLVSTLNSKASSKELKAIIHDIACLGAELSSISFHFVPRLNNVIADSLAKAALFAANAFSPRGV